MTRRLPTSASMLTRPHVARPIIRDLTGDDVATVVELWREFEVEVPELAWRDDEAGSHLRELERAIWTDIVLLAEQDARPVGLAVADTKGDRPPARDGWASPLPSSARRSTGCARKAAGCARKAATCSSSRSSPQTSVRAQSTSGGALRRRN